MPFHDDDRVLAGLTVGRLSSHRPFEPADLDQFVAFTAQAEVVVRLDRARLEQETMNMLREHDRIAADLHDHVITELFATGMGMQGMLAFLGREDRDRLSGYVDSLDGTIRRIRETIFELHPPDSPPPDVKQRLVAVLEDARPTLGPPGPPRVRRSAGGRGAPGDGRRPGRGRPGVAGQHARGTPVPATSGSGSR